MNTKKKICDDCGNDSYIWKTEGRLHYCKPCWLKRKPIRIKRVSDTKKQQDVIYLRLRKEFLNKPENQFCKAHLEGCSLMATDIHHKYSGKDRSKYYLNELFWIPVCRNCHTRIHSEMSSEELIQLGLKISN